ncbi:O-linked N-acetylglucosamine transferase [Amycolatopsis sp. NPDC051061]|uniref:O-linked N-acetylglucosamine transferase n=1 Tax=Amycolatopsis sp. NPDC051061 TaxID=3155042 RepID=UPI003432DDB3
MNPTTHPLTVTLVAEAVSEVHASLTRLLETLRRAEGESDAYVAACVACLEAAQAVTAVATGEQDPEHGGHQALYATNAAKLAIRFALVENGDARRSSSQADSQVSAS